MTQLWEGDKVFAVTRVKAEPCVVVQVKTEEKDGYNAVQLGYGIRKQKNIKKPQLGHMKDLGNFEKLREFRDKVENLKKGDKVTVETFGAGDKIDVIGTSKGKGFQGVVRRHGFHGQDATHGNKDQERMPGSIGSQAPQHVFKGTRMGGRMGGDRVTTANLKIAKVDIENNEIYIKGAIPGCDNGLVLLVGEGELRFEEAGKAVVVEEVVAPAEEKAEESVAEGVKEVVEEAKEEVKEKEENIEQVVIEASEKVQENKE